MRASKLNPKIPADALDDAFRKVTHTETPNLYENNHRFHRMLIDGIDVEYHAEGRIVHDKVWLVDFDDPDENGWLAVNQYTVTKKGLPELEVLFKEIFQRARFLDLVRHFIVFEVDGDRIAKKMAGYHQFHAVDKAVDCTLDAIAPKGNRRVGVVWHTQGSGKSLTMAFYSGKIIRHPNTKNPTLIVITDRNDLDDQLFGTFSSCHELLRQKPVQAEDRDDLLTAIRQFLGISSSS